MVSTKVDKKYEKLIKTIKKECNKSASELYGAKVSKDYSDGHCGIAQRIKNLIMLWEVNNSPN